MKTSIPFYFAVAGTDMLRNSISIFDRVYPLLWISIVVFIIGFILLVIPAIENYRQNIDRLLQVNGNNSTIFRSVLYLWRQSSHIGYNIETGIDTKGATMKLSKYGFLLTVLPFLFFTVSCSNSTATQTDSSSLTAIDQLWLENKPVSVSIMSDTIPTIVISDSTAIEHILSLVGNLSYYETSSENLQGGCPILTLEYPGRWILYEVMNHEYIRIIADGSTKEYRIPKEDGQALYDYLYNCLSDSNAAPT